MNFDSKILFHEELEGARGDFVIRKSRTGKNIAIVKYPIAELITEIENKYVSRKIDISRFSRKFTCFSPDEQFLIFVNSPSLDQYEIGIYNLQYDTLNIKLLPAAAPYTYLFFQYFPCYDSFIRLYAKGDKTLVLFDIDYHSLQRVITETEIPCSIDSYKLEMITASPMNKRFLCTVYTKSESEYMDNIIFLYDCETKVMQQLEKEWGLFPECLFSYDGQYLFGHGHSSLRLASLKDNILKYIYHNPSNSLISPVGEKIFIVENSESKDSDYYLTKNSYAKIFDDYEHKCNYHVIKHYVNEIDFYHTKNVALLDGRYEYSTGNVYYKYPMCTYYNFTTKEALDVISHIEEKGYVKFYYHIEDVVCVNIKDWFEWNSFFTAQGNILIKLDNRVFILQIEQ